MGRYRVRREGGSIRERCIRELVQGALTISGNHSRRRRGRSKRRRHVGRVFVSLLHIMQIGRPGLCRAPWDVRRPSARRCNPRFIGGQWRHAGCGHRCSSSQAIIRPMKSSRHPCWTSFNTCRWWRCCRAFLHQALRIPHRLFLGGHTVTTLNRQNVDQYNSRFVRAGESTMI